MKVEAEPFKLTYRGEGDWLAGTQVLVRASLLLTNIRPTSPLSYLAGPGLPRSGGRVGVEGLQPDQRRLQVAAEWSVPRCSLGSTFLLHGADQSLPLHGCHRGGGSRGQGRSWKKKNPPEMESEVLGSTPVCHHLTV